MTMRTAKDCFRENISLTGGAMADPVAFNLNNGLFNMAEALERQIDGLEKQVQQLQRKISDLEYAARR